MRKKSKFLSLFVYNKLFMLFIGLVLQFFLWFSFIRWLTPYISLYFGGSVALTAIFFIYLVNQGGKNEFKIAWLLPVTIAPLLGIFLYIFYHANHGGAWLKRELKLAKEKTKPFLQADLENTSVADNFDSKDLSTYLREKGPFPSYTNNKVSFIDSGEKFFDEFLVELKNAKQFIFIEFFIIYPDEAFETMLNVLKEKAAAGVEVRMLFDAIGSVALSTKRNLKYLHSCGIKAEVFIPLIPFFATQQNNRDHRKIAVIDNRIAYTGGVNVADEYFNYTHPRFNYWKDTAVRLEGPNVKTFTALFLENWTVSCKRKDRSEKFDTYFQTETGSFPSEGLIIPYGDDAQNEEDIAENIYMYILSKASNYIHITTPYFIVDNALMDALRFAGHRGLDVKMIVPSKPDHFITFCLGRIFIRDLISCGVKVYEYMPGFIHAKEFIADEKFATVGSVNLDYRSLYHHFECGVFMENVTAITQMEEDFQDTLKDCHQITLEEYKKIPLRIRILGRLFKVFAPMM